MQYTCTQCNTALTPGSTRCTNCGMTFASPVPYDGAPGYAYGQPPPKKSNVGLIVAICLGVGCLPVIAIVAAILFPAFAKVRQHAREITSQSNLKQLSLAALRYSQDHEQTYPPLDTFDHFKSAVIKYIPPGSHPDLFTQPNSGLQYATNPALSKKPVLAGDPVRDVMLYEQASNPGGYIYIVFADGHVKHAPQADLNLILTHKRPAQNTGASSTYPDNEP